MIPKIIRPTDGSDVPLPTLQPAEDARNPEAQALYALWKSLPRQGNWPHWGALDKTRLRRWMGWLTVYEAVDGWRDARYRLVGTGLVDHAGFDLTGRLVSEVVYATTPARLLTLLNCLTEGGVPIWIANPIITINGFSTSMHRFWVPFSNGTDELTVWVLLICDARPVGNRPGHRRLPGASP
jgi:hypothetical protein